MNLEIREFETAIVNFCNASQLPAEVKRLVLHNVAEQARKEADAAVRAEIIEREEQRTEKMEGGGESAEGV